MTTINQLNARLDQIDESIKAASNEIAACLTASYCTKNYAYSGFCFVDDFGRIEFNRNVDRYRATPTNGEAFFMEPVFLGGNVIRRSPCRYRKLPAPVREILQKMNNARVRINELNAERDALEAEIKAIEKFGAERVRVDEDGALVVRETHENFAPLFEKMDELIEHFEARKAAENEELPPPPAVIYVDPAAPELEPFDLTTAMSQTLAERVLEREQMYTGELPPFTPETMPECDKNLIEDINAALDEIDASAVNELLKYADDSERLGRNAKAAAYRQVAQLAAIYAINDAIEAQPEHEELLNVLFMWDNPADLPPFVSAGIATSSYYAKKVLDVSLQSPDDLGESSRLYSMANWSIDGELFRGMDDDAIRAFALHPACGIWIEYFNQTWIFTSDGVVDACAGSFESQSRVFVETLRRYLGPDSDDLC